MKKRVCVKMGYVGALAACASAMGALRPMGDDGLGAPASSGVKAKLAAKPVLLVPAPHLPPPAAIDLSRPPVLGGEAGLEATWLVSGADAAGLARTLAPYLGAQLPADAGAARLWEANGLRVVRVPLADWARVGAALGIGGASQRQWVDATGAWTEIVRGPERARGQVIALDAERLELAPGRLRLLARCWQTPVPAEGGSGKGPAAAELVVELLPQLREQGAGPGEMAIKLEAKTHSPTEEGLTFSRLEMRLNVRAESAVPGGRGVREGPAVLLVLAERPSADWVEAVREQDRAAEEASEAGPEHLTPGVGEVVRERPGAERGTATGRARSGGDAGPLAPVLPTLGEALFASETGTPSDGVTGGRRPARSVLVLVTRVPEVYRVGTPGR